MLNSEVLIANDQPISFFFVYHKSLADCKLSSVYMLHQECSGWINQTVRCQGAAACTYVDWKDKSFGH